VLVQEATLLQVLMGVASMHEAKFYGLFLFPGLKMITPYTAYSMLDAAFTDGALWASAFMNRMPDGDSRHPHTQSLNESALPGLFS